MRLLKRERSRWFANSYTFSLIECNSRDPPQYAILSHRWGPDEVTYQDIQEGTLKNKAGGYKKLLFCAEQAAHDGLLYFWVDTCCIDKANNTELSEAINSMYRWYQKATKCYVYFPDVSTQQGKWDTALQRSEWFTRGWTLQELIAPRVVDFFSVEGTKLGTKESLRQQLHEITGISVDALRGAPLSEIDEQERFSWTLKRKTTIDEDAVYCLLGIFGVYMPLIYGEGQQNALVRLHREIRLLSSSNVEISHMQWNADTPKIDTKTAHSADLRDRQDQNDPQLVKTDQSGNMTPEVVPNPASADRPLKSINYRARSESLEKALLCTIQDSTTGTRRLPRTGLTNMGSTCYMNSVLQCLSATPSLSTFFINDDAFKQFVQKNWKGSAGIMPEIFANVIKALWRKDVDTVRPTTFRNFCGRMDKEWISNQQQDAKEFFDFLLSCLHDDLNVCWERTTLRPLSTVQERQREQYKIFEAAPIEWLRYSHQDYSFISSLFAGQHALRFRCLTCNITSTTYHTFYSISLKAPPSLGRDIYDCLASYTAIQRGASDEKWTCPNCECETDATRQIILTHLPPNLVIHLERFTPEHFGGKRSTKNIVPVEFPLKELDLDRYVTTPEDRSANRVPRSLTPLRDSQEKSLNSFNLPPYHYECYAVIKHKGSSIKDGHYISCVKDKGRGCWREFDDDRYSDFDPTGLTRFDNRRLQTGEAYMLFFQKVMPG